MGRDCTSTQYASVNMFTLTLAVTIPLASSTQIHDWGTNQGCSRQDVAKCGDIGSGSKRLKTQPANPIARLPLHPICHLAELAAPAQVGIPSLRVSA